MAEAAFMKTQQLLPFLLSSFGSLFIAAQVGLIVFCHYQKENKIPQNPKYIRVCIYTHMEDSYKCI